MADVSQAGLPIYERRAGDSVFSAVLFLFALFLMANMWSQTLWQPGRPFAAQPGFWPRLAVCGMVACSAYNLYRSRLDLRVVTPEHSAARELLIWARSIEFALWFMAYVFATPVIGYLVASVLFAGALAVRAGYRTLRAILTAVAVGALTVVVFKAFLQVKIPGGAVYEALPDGVRNFFLIYL